MPPYLYLQQLARAWRYRNRYSRLIDNQRVPPGDEFNDLEDHLISTVLFVWHLKDWIYHDQHIDESKRKRIVGRAEASRELHLVADLANSLKHVVVTRSRAGAQETVIQLEDLPDGRASAHHIILDDSGSRQRAIDVIDAALSRWQELLDEETLPTFIDGPPAV